MFFITTWPRVSLNRSPELPPIYVQQKTWHSEQGIEILAKQTYNAVK